MRERVLAIVSLIAQYFLEDRDLTSEGDLVDELLSIGFESDEIDAAFNWMENQAFSPGESSLIPPARSHRIFSAEENRMLSNEARGFLVRLRSMGIIDDTALEDVIQKALQTFEDEVSLKEIKNLTVLALFTRSHNEWRREFDCLLEDDWSRLLH